MSGLQASAVTDWWCYRCGVTRAVAVCPTCGLKAPDEFCDPAQQTISSLQAVHSTLEQIEQTVSNLKAVPSTLEQILSTLKSRSDVFGLFWLCIFVFLLESWSGSSLDRWTDEAWYSIRYSAELRNITVEKRPSDCDFLHSPLGGKGCKYEKKHPIFGDEERRALIQQATTEEQKQTYAKQPNSVSVYWEKKEED